jgi:hypothetical protein
MTPTNMVEFGVFALLGLAVGVATKKWIMEEGISSEETRKRARIMTNLQIFAIVAYIVLRLLRVLVES